MRYLYFLGYLAIPLAFLVHFSGHGKNWEPTATFLLAALGVVPLAHLMGEATEQLTEKTGPTWGGLLNATFGNAAELIIAIIGLSKGLNDIVKASLTGSIIGNLLLVSGGAMVVGGWKREKQIFNRSSAETNAGLLAIAAAAMMLPAVFHFSFRLTDARLIEHEHAVSIGTSIILLAVYGLGMLFTLKTHAHVFTRPPCESPEDSGGYGGTHEAWSVRRSVLTLVAASAGVALVAELLVGSAESMAHKLGWNYIFVGVILLAIIGNAAEHSTALLLARRNDMETAMTITYQSSLQIALFVTPLLILLSAFMVSTGFGMTHGAERVAMNLIFSPLEVIAVFLSVAILILLGLNGETNWFEGALLLALYAILAIAFFYIPAGLPGR